MNKETSLSEKKDYFERYKKPPQWYFKEEDVREAVLRLKKKKVHLFRDVDYVKVSDIDEEFGEKLTAKTGVKE